MQLINKTVLLTGANGGLGQSLIQALLAEGVDKVYAACRKPSLLECNDARVIPVELDITDKASIALIRQQADDVDVLINNAGLNAQQRLLDAVDSDAARAEMAVNYFGTLDLCRAYAEVLRQRQGAVINVLSILARVALPAMGSLCASKAAGLRLTEGLRAELSGDGVHVMAVLPGVIDTAMSRDFPGPKAKPEAIAGAIVDALRNSVDTLYPDAMAQQVAAQLAADHDAATKSFSSFL